MLGRTKGEERMTIPSDPSPSAFLGKRVVVVGMSNTGCDIALELAGVAEKVYLSHRSGVRIVSHRPWIPT